MYIYNKSCLCQPILLVLCIDTMAVLEDNVSYLKISSFLDIWHKNVLLFYYIARVPKWITLCPGVWQIFWRVLKESVCVRICWKKNKRNFLYIKLKQDYVGNMSLLIVYKNEIECISYNFEGCHIDFRKLMRHEIPNRLLYR